MYMKLESFVFSLSVVVFYCNKFLASLCRWFGRIVYIVVKHERKLRSLSSTKGEPYLVEV
jgi:hypothetical protein